MSYEDDPRIEKYFPGIGKKPKAKRKPKSDEHTLQVQCVRWFGMQYSQAWRLLYMVKNDGYKRAFTNKSGKRFSPAANRDKMAGLVPGVADLHLSIPNGKFHSVYFELKTEKGRQSESQKEFELSVQHFNHDYVIIRSLDQFTEYVNNYLKDIDVAKIPQGRLGEDKKDILFG